MKNHHLLIKLLLSGQVELNPGPRSPRWPCGSCGKNVNWSSKALECDTCKTWYHTDCQGGMDTTMYNLMDISNLSWNCIKCGLPNFGSSFFYQTELSSFSKNNTYHALSEIDSPGKPHACSSPIAHQAKKGSSGIKVKNRIQRPLKIVNINFQSIKNKKPELDILLDTTKPDVIIGTETWLDPTISSYEYFPQDQYTVKYTTMTQTLFVWWSIGPVNSILILWEVFI
jgi:hypothetical protein